MGRVEKFEDLVAWQKARRLVADVYRVTSRAEFRRDFSLRDQMRRAAVSIMSNIAEGFERSGLGEFHQFLVIAKASCGELRSQLYVSQDVGYLAEDEFKNIHDKSIEVGRIIGGLRQAVSNKRTKVSS